MGTDIHGVFQKLTPHGWEDIPSNYEQNRHYQLFAVLAGVRNGFGFAGVPTGEAVTPISMPRGLPDDFALQTRVGDDEDDDEIEGYAVSPDCVDPRRQKWHSPGDLLFMGDHSHSWLTGSEMLAWAERAPVITKTGVLSREEYAKWDHASEPESYSGGIMGRDILVVNDDAISIANPAATHIRVEWRSGLKQELAYFFDEVARLVAEHGEIRFVFGFDS